MASSMNSEYLSRKNQRNLPTRQLRRFELGTSPVWEMLVPWRGSLGMLKIRYCRYSDIEMCL